MTLDKNDVSVYDRAFSDPKALHFTQDNYPELRTDNTDHFDVSNILQRAINNLSEKENYGIVFIPEGTYRISKTIYIPPAIRLIGYGKKRPVFVLPKDTAGFGGSIKHDGNETGSSSFSALTGANYMFWFTGNRPSGPEDAVDANAATFYSAISNIDFKVESGNPGAVIMRAHFAQHGFISHCSFDIGDGLAGIFDVGNEMEKLSFTGGQYGIICTKCSPGWPFALLDSTFTGQSKAAIKSRETGLTIFRMNVSGNPSVIDIMEDDWWEKLYMEDCVFDDISGPAINITCEDSSTNQINLRNIICRNVKTIARMKESGCLIHPNVNGSECASEYIIKSFLHGLSMGSMTDKPEMQTRLVCISANKACPAPESDIPLLPAQSCWVNAASYGAVGDGETDDTSALQKAIDENKVVYLPQGIYLVTDTIFLRKDTVLIGMDPISTQIIIKDDSPAFSGFGSSKALVETSRGGVNIINGIGLDTAGKNPRAVGCKWMAGAGSYMNDVKFVGGHGLIPKIGGLMAGYASLYNPSRTGDGNVDRVWDFQYASLWITEQGGGVFKDIWSASPYAEAGIYISDTQTPGRMYAISLEHHVRHEMKLRNVSNWSFYALQTEEEKAEGLSCLPLEMTNCSSLLFANFYIFRVVAVNKPFPHAIRIWNCRKLEMLNMHNFSQMQFTFTDLIYDAAKDMSVYPWQIAELIITGDEAKTGMINPTPNNTGNSYNVYKAAGGFEFATALTMDSKGNVYFCDPCQKRIYKCDASSNQVSVFYDIHFTPLSLFCDTKDNLIVVVEYTPLKTTVHGKMPGFGMRSFPKNTGSSFHMFAFGRAHKVYSMHTDNPDATMKELVSVPWAEMKKSKTVYYPSNLWHDDHDYKEAVVRPAENCYIAPDGETALADTIDLTRATMLSPARFGCRFLAVDEYYKRVYELNVLADMRLADPRLFAELGEYSTAIGSHGQVYIADGLIHIYKDKNEFKALRLPERPACILLDERNKRLFVTARTSFYILNI